MSQNNNPVSILDLEKSSNPINKNPNNSIQLEQTPIEFFDKSESLPYSIPNINFKQDNTKTEKESNHFPISIFASKFIK